MQLTKAFQHHFSSAIRARGATYFIESRVRTVYEDEEDYVTVVTGAKKYGVSLRFNDSFAYNSDYFDSELNCQCDCPSFSPGHPCKHIWATFLAAEKSRWEALEDITARTEFSAEKYPSDDEDDGDGDGDDDDDNDDDDDDSEFDPSAGEDHSPVDPSAGFNWEILLGEIQSRQQSPVNPRPHVAAHPDPGVVGTNVELWFAHDIQASLRHGALNIQVMRREQSPSSDAWSPLRECDLTAKTISDTTDPKERQFLLSLLGSIQDRPRPGQLAIQQNLADVILPTLVHSGRFLAFRGAALPKEQRETPIPIAPHAGAYWKFILEILPAETRPNAFELIGKLYRNESVDGGGSGEKETGMPLCDTGVMFTPTPGRGYFLKAGTMHATETLTVSERLWIKTLNGAPPCLMTQSDLPAFIAKLAKMPSPPTLRMGPESNWRVESGIPAPYLDIEVPSYQSWDLLAYAAFEYDAQTNDAQTNDGKTIYLPDAVAESQHLDFLRRISGVRFLDKYDKPSRRGQALRFSATDLEKITETLTTAGWTVTADGRSLTRSRGFNAIVASGTDWFELSGTCSYGTTTVPLPDLLAAAKKGQSIILLPDGSSGLLPAKWLAKYAGLVKTATPDGEKLLFRRWQASLLDGLLDGLSEGFGAGCSRIEIDPAFTNLRKKIRRFDGIEILNPAPGFNGTLRPYQQEGLGWIQFLREFDFGGCLADDMGLGKTIQVLAALHAHYTPAKKGKTPRRPSLVVVPKSLVHNWLLEAQRFCPDLKFVDASGARRLAHWANTSEFDVAVTTYGFMRQDIKTIAEIDFEFVILDEAQAIKNSTTQVCQAARQLKGKTRLALSGTPVENHLGELASIFEFLNPGISKCLQGSFGGYGPNSWRNLSADNLDVLARAVRPFILRRTKEQVLKDLPDKIEQTIYCDLPAKQRKSYDELRTYYRASVLGKVKKNGLAKSKIVVLEALLRLRQAACHPGLIDKKAAKESSAKLDVLMEQLKEIISTGHKALVFSQFTSLLDIVRNNLDKEKIVYEYLDGQTRDRAGAVDRFQNDPDGKIPVFLISLKAGGVGLNLTAADYCFILDPWWNPSAEAQAISRAHRIGQTRKVIAHRLIARDTVEEKIVALQAQKRGLAESVMNIENSTLGSMTLDDLNSLLS